MKRFPSLSNLEIDYLFLKHLQLTVPEMLQSYLTNDFPKYTSYKSLQSQAKLRPTSKIDQSWQSVLHSIPVFPVFPISDIVVADPIFQTDVQQMVVVTEINNPWSFYVQIMNPAYDHFMEEMW